MIDAASGGALGDMTSVEARNLIEKMSFFGPWLRGRL